MEARNHKLLMGGQAEQRLRNFSAAGGAEAAELFCRCSGLHWLRKFLRLSILAMIFSAILSSKSYTLVQAPGPHTSHLSRLLHVPATLVKLFITLPNICLTQQSLQGPQVLESHPFLATRNNFLLRISCINRDRKYDLFCNCNKTINMSTTATSARRCPHQHPRSQGGALLPSRPSALEWPARAPCSQALIMVKPVAA